MIRICLEHINVRARRRGAGQLFFGGRMFACALGRSGIAQAKREGDGATPAGVFALRQVFYRPERIARPRTGLQLQPIRPADQWCEDPAHPAYNRLMRRPAGAGAPERLRRADPLYDVFAVIGHNDAPVRKGRGSAIFLHIARPGLSPTEGCIALRRTDLLWLLARCGRRTRIRIIPPLPKGAGRTGRARS